MRICIIMYRLLYFLFNDTATTEIYTLSLHDALPILRPSSGLPRTLGRGERRVWKAGLSRSRARGSEEGAWTRRRDRKSTRLNSSHVSISYAVFCLKKKKKK